jgi:hypothetical protein
LQLHIKQHHNRIDTESEAAVHEEIRFIWWPKAALYDMPVKWFELHRYEDGWSFYLGEQHNQERGINIQISARRFGRCKT